MAIFAIKIELRKTPWIVDPFQVAMRRKAA